MGPNTICQSATEAVMVDLVHRIATLDLHSDRAPCAVLAAELDAIRTIAQRAGMLPAVSVAHVLDAALARGERGPLIHAWLDVLRDAVGCGRDDRQACDTYIGACSVRLAS